MSRRDPLLLNDMVPQPPPFDESEAQEAFYTGIDWARDHYERLIDEGKLRVVEEVEWSSQKPGCERCGHPWALLLQQSIFCPGCGNKIKR